MLSGWIGQFQQCKTKIIIKKQNKQKKPKEVMDFRGENITEILIASRASCFVSNL